MDGLLSQIFAGKAGDGDALFTQKQKGPLLKIARLFFLNGMPSEPPWLGRVTQQMRSLAAVWLQNDPK
jgi:hypothetical protein